MALSIVLRAGHLSTVRESRDLMCLLLKVLDEVKEQWILAISASSRSGMAQVRLIQRLWRSSDPGLE